MHIGRQLSFSLVLLLLSVLTACRADPSSFMAGPAAHEAPFTPSDTVIAWARSFPHEMLLAGVLTTSHFRDGLSLKEWVETKQTVFTNIQFRYLKGTIISGWVEGEKALVVFESTSMSVKGPHFRREQYQLIKSPEGMWLIDEVKLDVRNLI